MIMSPSMKKMMCVMTVDVVCILLVAIPCLLLNLIGEPYVRGFYCSDTSLHYPYLDSTMPTWALIMVSYILPGTIFCLVETSILKHIGTFTSIRLARVLYNTVGVFVFGSLVNRLLTDITKYSMGSLRPHFLSVCKPNITLDTGICGDSNNPVYITQYGCTGQEDMLRDTRLSFVSGHASMSAYSMCFTVIYIHRRMVTRNYRLVKPLIQVTCALFALFTSLSRISDHKHHSQDVLGGAILGILISMLTINFLTQKQEKIFNRATSTTSLMNMSTSRLYTEELLVSPKNMPMPSSAESNNKY